MNDSKPVISAAGHRAPLVGEPLAAIAKRDEFLHPVAPGAGYASTETSYFGFNIPEKQLNGEIYVWFHPALRVMSASVYIWRGIRRSTLACDYVNHFHFLPFPGGDIDDYEIAPLGLRIRVMEPLEALEITCKDPERNVSFRLVQKAIMPPAGRPGGFHFTQAMKVDGELNLHGEQFVVDGYFSRDRSWGQERHEVARSMPPLSWMVGIFGDDLAFHVLAFDDPALGPETADVFASPPPGRNLIWGYVWRGGTLLPVKRAGLLTTREPDGLAPRVKQMEVEDAGGQVHRIRGTVDARMPWQTWQNMNVYFCLTRWEWDGRIGWGDTQDIQYNEFVRRFARF
ncbi:MAG: hypothetical protein GC201_05765 [Alphaproteobacteria bacterium]|nr:hypothetical protein [Alphaproteobacteria bacterium]